MFDWRNKMSDSNRMTDKVPNEPPNSFTSAISIHKQVKKDIVDFKNKMSKIAKNNQLGSVAGPVIQATGRLVSEDGLRTGVLLHMGSR